MFNSVVNQMPCGIAYIAWPSDIDRDEYLRDCFTNNRVSLWLEDGALVNRAVCTKGLFNKISFPKKVTEKGSAVVYVSDAVHNTPIVIGGITSKDEIGNLKEEQFFFGKIFEEKVISISGDAKKGAMSVNLDAGTGKGKFFFEVNNDSSDCEVEFSIKGSWKASVQEQLLMVSEEEIKLIIDHLGDRPSLVKIRDKEISLSSAKIQFSGKDIFIKNDNGIEIVLNDNGIQVNGNDKPIFLQSGESKINIGKKKINIEGDKVSINGRFPIVYCKTPSVPLTRIEQLGVSKKITVG